MEKGFVELLRGADIFGVLNDEAIHTFQVFQLLQEEPFQKLLDKLPLGQHMPYSPKFGRKVALKVMFIVVS